MTGLIKIVGMVVVVFGAIYFVKPTVVKQVMRFWMKTNRLYVGAAVSLLVGIIFLISASRCTVGWFVVLLGLASIAKGVVIVVAGKKKIMAWADELMKKPTKTLRVFAIITLVIGALIILAV